MVCYEYSEETSRFYISQLVLVLEYLHNVEVLYRDLKPENLLVDSEGYIKVQFSIIVHVRTDFLYIGWIKGSILEVVPYSVVPWRVVSVGGCRKCFIVNLWTTEIVFLNTLYRNNKQSFVYQ